MCLIRVKNQGVCKAAFLSRSSRREYISLSSPASKGPYIFLACGPIAPSSKSGGAGQILLMVQHPDFLFCLLLPFLRTLVIAFDTPDNSG